MNDVLPLPPAHPFSQGLPRPPTPSLRSSSPSGYALSAAGSASLPSLPASLRAPSAASGRFGAAAGTLLSVPERPRPRPQPQRRLSLSNYFLDIDIEYARRDVPRPKLIVTVVRPSPPGGEWREDNRGQESHDRRSEDTQPAPPETGTRVDTGRVVRRKNRASKRERRRLFHASLERLAVLERMLEDSGGEGGEQGLRGGPRSAPVAHAPAAEPDLRRAHSLPYHPYSSPVASAPDADTEQDEHLDFEYLLSPAEPHEPAYELSALEFGPRLGASVKRDWDALAPPPDDELGLCPGFGLGLGLGLGLGMGLGALPDAEWRHPYAAAQS